MKYFALRSWQHMSPYLSAKRRQTHFSISASLKILVLVISRPPKSFGKHKQSHSGILLELLRPRKEIAAGSPAPFSFLYFKKTKFQKYMLNREIFKNGWLSPPTGCLSPIQWATGPKCKKISFLHLGPGVHGALNIELVKSI